mmetsp:Transcript_22406/g.44968  ORF Transcript_22406/g.44968 Transcript_22406/m.44968 type:complete len:95 (+) Transcript_22406:431-715(+)
MTRQSISSTHFFGGQTSVDLQSPEVQATLVMFRSLRLDTPRDAGFADAQIAIKRLGFFDRKPERARSAACITYLHRRNGWGASGKNEKVTGSYV